MKFLTAAVALVLLMSLSLAAPTMQITVEVPDLHGTATFSGVSMPPISFPKVPGLHLPAVSFPPVPSFTVPSVSIPPLSLTELTSLPPVSLPEPTLPTVALSPVSFPLPKVQLAPSPLPSFLEGNRRAGPLPLAPVN